MVIVSDFAKGVDRHALESVMKTWGRKHYCITTREIATFVSGFKTYYEQIQEGSVLILSTFDPKVKWSKNLAMARNSTIYEFAEEIYVAESRYINKGGTYAGVIEGLKKMKIYVIGNGCFKRGGDKNLLLNDELIQVGAQAVDNCGNLLVEGKTSGGNKGKIQQ